MDNRLIARIARVGGARLLDRTVAKVFPDTPASAIAGKGKHPGKSGGITGAVVGTVLTRIATRSVPGAILIGGGLLAKTLYDRKKQKAPATNGSDGEGNA